MATKKRSKTKSKTTKRQKTTRQKQRSDALGVTVGSRGMLAVANKSPKPLTKP